MNFSCYGNSKAPNKQLGLFVLRWRIWAKWGEWHTTTQSPLTKPLAMRLSEKAERVKEDKLFSSQRCYWDQQARIPTVLCQATFGLRGTERKMDGNVTNPYRDIFFNILIISFLKSKPNNSQRNKPVSLKKKKTKVWFFMQL